MAQDLRYDECDTTPDPVDFLQVQIDGLKANLTALSETIQCLPLSEPVSVDPGSTDFPGASVSTLAGGKQLPGVGLTTCQSYRVWRNRTAAPKDRTVEVRPTGQTFPAGSTVTVFTAPDNTEGNAPPAGAPSVPVGDAGDAIGITVPVNQSVFVHYLAPRGGRGRPNNIRAEISQSI